MHGLDHGEVKAIYRVQNSLVTRSTRRHSTITPIFGRKNPTAANRAGLILQTGAKRLADFPGIGYPMNDGTDRRELFLPFGTGGYVLRYITDMEVIVIIRAWHSKEQRFES
jgi:plasmid stabilization system protein ParE